jgi:hypothetical protein
MISILSEFRQERKQACIGNLFARLPEFGPYRLTASRMLLSGKNVLDAIAAAQAR